MTDSISSANSELREKLKQMIAEEFTIPIEKLTPEATMESLGIDSLALIDFMFNVEDKLGIEMPDSRAPLTTLGEVYAEIEKAKPKALKNA
jgi:acyl carrier protein